jgi:hypothetical protein
MINYHASHYIMNKKFKENGNRREEIISDVRYEYNYLCCFTEAD